VVFEGDADPAHFGPVHGLEVMDHSARYEGHRAEFRYQLGPEPAEVHVVLDGLTRLYQTVRMHAGDLGLIELHYSGSFMPLDGGRCRVDNRFWVFADDRRRAREWMRSAAAGFSLAVGQDAAIWALRSDGPLDAPTDPDIAAFRRWARPLLCAERLG
jgi:hypothetical protein